MPRLITRWYLHDSRNGDIYRVYSNGVHGGYNDNDCSTDGWNNGYNHGHNNFVSMKL